MALDTELLYRPTESLLSPSGRRFFPFKIPNTSVYTPILRSCYWIHGWDANELVVDFALPEIRHHQLRHYISTADPDRIYVAVGRIIYAIYISSQKREILTIVPFDPKCLTAGNGWIGVGGTESGDCAFIKLDQGLQGPETAVPGSPVDVDSPLPLDLDTPIPRRTLPYPPNVSVRELGGSIVNSVTIHRLPSIGDDFVDEDIAVLSNNDTTVSIFSLPRMEVIETIRHPVCMNFAIISPDSRLLAAVGDENRVYFYRVIPSDKQTAVSVDGKKLLREWSWPLLRSVELDSDPNYDDRCCFTIAFSPSSHLCAVASQAGVITVFSVNDIFRPDPNGRSGREDILYVFRSSRSCFDGGAIRCMTFSPEPWDLLVWVEDHGRAGVADVRQDFSRRQILTLDIDEPGLERVKTDNLDKPETELELDVDLHRPDSAVNQTWAHRLNETDDPLQRGIDSNRYRRRGTTAEAESQIMRDSLARDLTARERQIIDFLNTARWASSIEEGPQRLPHLISPLPYAASSTYQQRAASQFLGSSPPPPPPPPPPDHYITRNEPSRNSDRPRTGAPRRRNSVVLSQDSSSRPNVHTSSALIPHPGISLRWPYSPNQVPAPNDDPETLSMEDDFPRIPSPNQDGVQTGPSNSSHRGSRGPQPEDAASSSSRPTTGQRQRLTRSRSIPRRVDRVARAPGERLEPRNTNDSELRSTLAAERLRAQRQAAVEESQRLSEWEQQYRRVLELDNIRSSPRVRNLPGEVNGSRESGWGVGTAGVGWSEDGRTL
ncbi:hypothetical protein McaMca56_005337 [Microsporum canis]